MSVTTEPTAIDLQRALRESEKQSMKKNSSAIEITHNLADVKTHLTKRMMALDSVSKLPKSQYFGGGDFTIHVESRLYKGERPSNLSEKKSKFTRSKDSSFKSDYSGAPFNTQTQRFSTSGVHPRHYQYSKMNPVIHKPTNEELKMHALNKPPLEKTKTVMKHMTKAQKDFSAGWRDTDWYKKMVMTMSQIDMKKKQVELERERGPGKYHISADFLKSHVSVAMSKAGRFVGDNPVTPIKRGHLHYRKIRKTMANPGPGTYTINNEKERIHGDHCTFDSSNNEYGRQRVLCSELPPGLYPVKSFVDDLLAKKAGKKGPYQVFTISRDKVLDKGSSKMLQGAHSYTQDKPWISPGMYNPEEPKCTIKPRELDELKISKSTIPHKLYPPLYRISTTPAPCAYNGNIHKVIEEDPRIHTVRSNKHVSPLVAVKNALWHDNYGFLSSTKRHDKVSNDRWVYSHSKIGPGRYTVKNLVIGEERANAHTNVFKSEAVRKLSTVVGQKERDRKQRVVAFNRINQRLEKLEPITRKFFVNFTEPTIKSDNKDAVASVNSIAKE